MDQKFQPSGEPETDFERGGGGEFNCGNCIHMKGEVCIHPIMMAISRQPGRLPQSRRR